jgi:hypothetical protein
MKPSAEHGVRIRGVRTLSLRTPHSALLSQAVACVLVLCACSNERPRTGLCSVEQLEVTWPATIERNGVATSERLEAALTPTNVTPEVFDSLATTLVRGRADAPAVVWSVPAFNTNPGGIAIVHKGALRRGEVLRVAGVLDAGGWGVLPQVARDSALVAVEAGEFAAREASGTIVVLETQPVALRLDVTARDTAGATMRIRGDAQFSVRRERKRCAALAESSGA